MAKKKNSFEQRFVQGLPIGVAIGIVLSMTMENWGMLGVGIALAAAFGTVGSERDEETDRSTPVAGLEGVVGQQRRPGEVADQPER